MTETFTKNNSGLYKMGRVARSEFWTIIIVVACGLLILGCLGWLVRSYDINRIEENKSFADSVASETTNQKLRLLLDEYFKPRDARLDSMARIVKIMSRDWDEYTQELAPSAAPIKSDTAKIFEQKPSEEKK